MRSFHYPGSGERVVGTNKNQSTSAGRMRRISRILRRWRTFLVARWPALAAWGLLVGAEAGWAQGPTQVYTNKTAFRLPIKLDEGRQADLREVQLFVKAGNGPWTQKDTAP